MQNPPPVQTAKSSTGLDENVAALLSYIMTWITGLVFFFIEKSSRLVRFHAMQAILLGVTAIVLGFVLWFGWIIFAVVGAMIADVLPALVSLVFGLLFFVFWVGIMIAWIMCLIKAYQGQYFKLPIIGNFAEKFSAR
ncbi:MAG TPA: hypothetical protein VFR78_04035 [Pyrinomonadaceae bacterium]|nr:hypothetical protein [Pyrinomonadaceae bacterium]